MANNSMYRMAYLQRLDNDGDMEGVREMLNWPEWKFQGDQSKRNPSAQPGPKDPTPTKIEATPGE